MNSVRGGISQILIYQIYYNLTHISYSFTKYTNWWLVCLQNCTLITTVNLVTFLSPQKEIPLRLVISNSFIPSSLAQTNPLSISGLLSLNILFSRFIHVVVRVGTSFFFIAEWVIFHWVHISYFIHQLMDIGLFPMLGYYE